MCDAGASRSPLRPSQRATDHRPTTACADVQADVPCLRQCKPAHSLCICKGKQSSLECFIRLALLIVAIGFLELTRLGEEAPHTCRVPMMLADRGIDAPSWPSLGGPSGVPQRHRAPSCGRIVAAPSSVLRPVQLAKARDPLGNARQEAMRRAATGGESRDASTG